MIASMKRPLPASLLASAILCGCSSGPPMNSLATVAVQATVLPADIEADHTRAIRMRQALQTAGIANEAILAGRVVRVACAMMSDGTWGGLGVLPAGVRAANDSVWRLRVLDVGDNEREPVNPLLEARPELTWSGKPAYAFVPNWRELGRTTNLDKIAVPKDQRSHYEVVFSRHLVRCVS